MFSCVKVSENPLGGSFNGATTIKCAYFGVKWLVFDKVLMLFLVKCYDNKMV